MEKRGFFLNLLNLSSDNSRGGEIFEIITIIFVCQMVVAIIRSIQLFYHLIVAFILREFLFLFSFLLILVGVKFAFFGF